MADVMENFAPEALVVAIATCAFANCGNTVAKRHSVGWITLR